MWSRPLSMLFEIVTPLVPPKGHCPSLSLSAMCELNSIADAWTWEQLLCVVGSWSRPTECSECFRASSVLLMFSDLRNRTQLLTFLAHTQSADCSAFTLHYRSHFPSSLLFFTHSSKIAYLISQAAGLLKFCEKFVLTISITNIKLKTVVNMLNKL